MIVSDRQALCEAASAAAEQAYAPYSSFRVGAAVKTDLGVVTGSNVENASFGLSLCAERSALAAAVGQGASQITAIAVACVDADRSAPLTSRMPCGACRQWINELAPEAVILICGTDAEFPISDLLPSPFDLPDGSG